MNKEIIAVVQLSPGEAGFYDELSRIYLTASNPKRDITAGTNCTQLRRSVKSGRLKLLSGSLGEEKKLSFGKKGNKFTGTAEAEAIQVVVPVIEKEIIVEAVKEVIEAPVVEAPAFIEETGIVEIVPVIPVAVIEPEVAEEITAVEAVEEAAEVAEIVEETADVKKVSRKKK